MTTPDFEAIASRVYGNASVRGNTMLLDAHTHFYLDAHTYFSLEELREELNKNKHNNLINKIQHGKE